MIFNNCLMDSACAEQVKTLTFRIQIIIEKKDNNFDKKSKA